MICEPTVEKRSNGCFDGFRLVVAGDELRNVRVQPAQQLQTVALALGFEFLLRVCLEETVLQIMVHSLDAAAVK